jgi:hypothetical protein
MSLFYSLLISAVLAQSPCSAEATGLQNHSTYVTRADTETSFSDSTTAVFNSASVPDALRLHHKISGANKNDLLMYFGRNGICESRSTDHGRTWSDPLTVTFNGLQNSGGEVDPSITQEHDGTLRLYFYGPTSSNGDPAQISGDHVIYSATSTDGVNFTVEAGQRFADTTITDPEVVKFQGQYFMYLSAGATTRITESSDGLTFTDTGDTWNSAGIPGAVAHHNTLHIYGCSGSDSIVSASSSDGLQFGSTSTVLTTTDQSVTSTCDPSPIRLKNGHFVLVYKKAVS